MVAFEQKPEGSGETKCQELCQFWWLLLLVDVVFARKTTAAAALAVSINFSDFDDGAALLHLGI